MADGSKNWTIPRLRLWHLFVLIAIIAFTIPRITLFGNSPAVAKIVAMSVSEDDVWKKHFASLEFQFISPTQMNDEVFCCFFEVGEGFSFGDEYKTGDLLRFRFQYKDFWNWKKEDPCVIIMREFFDRDVVPRQFGNQYYLRRPTK